jgi:YVTN family beta-propeller protein
VTVIRRPISTAALFLAAAALLFALGAPGASARNAYVTNAGSGNVSVIDTATNQVVGEAIKVGAGAREIALAPDGSRAYVSGRVSKDITVIDTRTNQVLGSPIAVPDDPITIALAPDGRHLYVAQLHTESVLVIDTATNSLVGAPIKVGNTPRGIAFTPDGRRAYVVNKLSEDVSVIDTATNQVLGAPIDVGAVPRSIASSGNVSVIDTATNQVVGEPIVVETGKSLSGIAITPDGSRAYVVDEALGALSVIDTATNQVVGLPIKVGTDPRSVAITPDGSRAYVTNEGSDNVSVLDIATNQLVGGPIGVGETPFGVAISPDQPSLASFKALPAFNAPRARPGVPVTFNASASTDPDGTISAFDWSFGDKRVSQRKSPTATHTYAKPGTYRVTLTLTDNEGCSTSLIFTGQTAFCNGQASAQATRRVNVSYPGVRVRCPRSARPRGCRFALQVIARKPKLGKKARTESAVARTKVRPGRAAIVSLRPDASHRRILARVRNVLVKETEKIGGLQRVRFRRLRIVQ